ncbi:MAG TPA: TetR/AcrR family transcriptional regulator [Baekduia sp.]|uniref:TetR/AcrR family transcriptional regulator n=1 Tax=Baekduia sp. TaxID=2600305 RepID=UPI002D7776C1|nr:TetR/AcrR family transcriptional regulator [Baekduia sp.]HET6507239.1 TetR/AcrR family transcriptional regulator [Baekduia sp.]
MARMNAQERRDQLLDVLSGIVLSEGYGAVSIDRVSRDAQIARTVIYSHFDNLDGLLHALIERTEQRALGQIRAVIPDIDFEEDPDAVLVEALRTFLTMVRDEPDTWRLALFPVEGAPPELRETIARVRGGLLGLLQPVAVQGLERRGGPKGLDVELFSRMLIACAEEGAKLVLSDPDAYPPDRLAAFTETIMGAVARG